jgi:hypothetical protein
MLPVCNTLQQLGGWITRLEWNWHNSAALPSCFLHFRLRSHASWESNHYSCRRKQRRSLRLKLGQETSIVLELRLDLVRIREDAHSLHQIIATRDATSTETFDRRSADSLRLPILEQDLWFLGQGRSDIMCENGVGSHMRARHVDGRAPRAQRNGRQRVPNVVELRHQDSPYAYTSEVIAPQIEQSSLIGLHVRRTQ